MSIKQSFYIKNRKERSTKTKKNFYAVFPLEDGKNISRSVDSLYFSLYGEEKHIGNRNEAVLVAQAALDKGIIQAYRNKSLLVPFILKYWNYDESPYRIEAEYSGKKLGKTHFDCMLRSFNSYCLDIIPPSLPYEGMTLSLLEDIKAHLREKNLAPTTYNKALGSIRQPLEYLYQKGKITTNFADRIKNIPQKNKKDKGIFVSKAEAEKFLRYLKGTYSPDSYDRWRYLIPALSYYSGMREGEIRALKKVDITLEEGKEMGIILVAHAYNEDEREGDRYKCTKGKEKRYTVVPSPLLKEVLNFLNLSPYPDGYIFFSNVKPLVPINKTTISGAFNEDLCNALEMTEEERKERNITFHSLRHEFNTNLVNSGMSGEIIRSMTGHKSEGMTEHYTHQTEDGLNELAKAVSKSIPYID